MNEEVAGVEIDDADDKTDDTVDVASGDAADGGVLVLITLLETGVKPKMDLTGVGVKICELSEESEAG